MTTTHYECTGQKNTFPKSGHYSLEKTRGGTEGWRGWGIFTHSGRPQLGWDGFKTKKSALDYLRENFETVRKHIE